MFRAVSCAVLALLALAICRAGGQISADDQPSVAEGAADAKTEPSEPPAPVKYKLALKFEPNQIVRYQIWQESEITTAVSGETETAKNATQCKRHYKVTAVDEKTGAGDLELSIDWVHMVASFENGNSEPQPIEFQSDDPEKHPDKYKHILETVGRPRAAIRFSVQGQPLEVLWGAPRQQSPPAGAAGAASSGAGLETTPETYFLPLPDRAVAIGESWREQFHLLARDSNKNLARVTIQRRYELTAVEKERATIEFQTRVVTPSAIDDSSIAGQMIQREISGKLVLDLERGLVLSRESGVDKTVLNPFGQKSQMSAKTVYRERLLEDEADGEASAAATAKK